MPLEAPIRHANGAHWGRFIRTIIEVETDEGITGLGEMGGGGESSENAFKSLKSYLVGHDPFQLEAMYWKICNPTASLYNNRTQLHAALEKIAAAGRGVVLYLRQREHSLDLVNQLRTYAVMQHRNVGKREASLETGYGSDRDYGVGAQILHDLGLRRIQLLTNHPPKVAALEGFALEVVGNIPLGQPAHLKDSSGEQKPENKEQRI